MTIKLEGLVIPVGWDTGALMQGLELIKSGVDKVVDIANQAIDRTRAWAEDLDRLGDVTGMNAGELAAWGFVAKKAGVPVDSLSRGLVILEKGLVKADGSLDTMGKALKDYGVNVFGANGKLKDQSTLMNDIALKYASFSTQQERVNFLTAIFGRSGADLVDVFDTLAAEGGIDAVTKKVGDLGLALDPTTFENFERNLNEIDATFTGLSTTFTTTLMPGLAALVETFRGWLEQPWIAEAIGGIGISLGALLMDINTGLTTGNWDAFWGDANEIWEALKGKVEEALTLGIAWLDSNPTAITDFIDGLLGGFNAGMAAAPKDKLSILAQTFANKLGAQLAAVDWGAALAAFWANLSAAPIPTIDWGNKLGLQMREQIIEAVRSTLADSLQQWKDNADQLREIWRKQISNMINGVIGDVANLTQAVYDLGAAFMSLALPDWLTPGSPTPLEMGIKGINNALSEMSGGALPSFNPAGATVAATAPAGGFEFDYNKFAAIIATEFAKATG